MLRLFYSNRTEELSRQLASRIRAEQRKAPLSPVRVVVPNACVEAYVKLAVARERGVAANLETMLLTRFVAGLAPAGTRVADGGALEAFVLTLLLDDEFVEKEDLAPVQAYLRSAGSSEDAIDLRRVQLASRLGRIFEEYTYSRMDMLSAWWGGAPLAGPRAETARWQRAMIQAIFGEGGLASRKAPRLLPLGDAAALLAAASEATPPAFHVFGFSHVARGFYDLFDKLARTSEVFLYSLSPCEGFWEDVDPRDPAPLHLWGRPGRDHVRVLNALSGFDHDDAFVDPLESGPHTLLRRLQSDILHRHRAAPAPRDPAAGASDGSLLFTEHASVRRELEAVASSIWALIERDASLPLDEIAVLLPPAEAPRYAAHLPTVFREAHDLPFQMIGLAAPTPSPIAEAIDLLLALPLARFSRSELLRLVVHPSLTAGFGEVDAARWSSWCDALGIVHGADRSDHEGTYIERDVLNWDQGIRRLALGAFMSGDTGDRQRDPDASPFVLGADAYAPWEVAEAELKDAAAFGLLARSLLADAKFARAQRLRLPEWADLLCTIVSTYVTPVGPDEPEEMTRFLRKLKSLGEDDLTGKSVSYRIAYELAARKLRAGASGSGSGGVVVSTIAALGGVPFRAVFACGMGEGRFPSPEGEDPLDLRWATRREGDVTSRDRDKYAFLELLLGARDRLVVSYVSRDALTGDALAPSSVVQELLYALGRGYVDDVGALRRRHPLRRWDPSYPRRSSSEEAEKAGALDPIVLPEARAEAATLAVRRNLERSGAPRGAKEIRERAEADEPGWRTLAEHLGMPFLPPPAERAEARVAVPLHALAKFLEFPLHGWAAFRFGLGELEDEDILARESEPFETELREETLFLRAIVLSAKRRAVELEGAYDAAVRARELRGTGPSGAFARGERTEHLQTLATWSSELAREQVAIDSLAVHRFGRTSQPAESDEVHDALAFEVAVTDGEKTRILRAELTGRTLPLGAGDSASVTLAKRAEAEGDDWVVAGRRRTLLRSFLDHAVLCASGATAPARSALIVVATPDGPTTERVALAPLSQDKALLWLRGLVQELLEGSHAYFFPYEAVFVHRARGGKSPISDVLGEARDKLRESRGALALRSAYGPVPRPHEYPFPDEGAALAMVLCRFGALFEGWRAPAS